MTTYAREQDLIGWLMTQQSFPEALNEVQDKWFSDRLHGQIFNAIRKLLEAEDMAIPPNVVDLLNQHDPVNPHLADERHEYVWSLVKNAGPMNLNYTLKALRERGKRHEMKLALLAAVNEMEEHDSYENALSAALGQIDGIALQGVDKGLITGHDLNLIGARWLQERNERQGELPGLPTGFPDLDKVIYGLKPAELITVAGASGMGKTTFATNIVEQVAKGWIGYDDQPEPGRNVLVVSREMGETQISLRHFASQGGIDLDALQTGMLNDEDYISLNAACSSIGEMRVFYDLDSITPNQVALRARQLKRKYGSIGLILVDQISLMRSDQPRRSKQEEVSDITWGFKNIARDFNIPVVLLSQITRDIKHRTDKRPQLTDMSDSSSVEKDSDVVIGIYRDDYYHPDSPYQGMAEAIVLKNRMGKCKTVPLVYQGQYNRYRPCDLATWHEAKRIAEGPNNEPKKMRFKT